MKLILYERINVMQECAKCGKLKPIDDFEGCKTCSQCRQRCLDSHYRCLKRVRDLNEFNGNVMQYCLGCKTNKFIEEFDGYKRCNECRIREREEYKIEGAQGRRAKRAARIITEMFTAVRRKAKLSNLEFNLTKEYLESIFPKNKMCPIRNVVMSVCPMNDKSNSFSLDRIDNTKGYVIGNVQIISNKANRVKYTSTLTELEMFKKLNPPQIHSIDNDTRAIIIKDRMELCVGIIDDEWLIDRILDRERYMISQTKARSKKQGINFNLDVDYIKSIFPLNNCCPVLGFKFGYNNINTSASIDRIDPKLGYIKGNIQIISRRANCIKANCNMQELFSIIDAFRELYDRTGSGIVI